MRCIFLTLLLITVNSCAQSEKEKKLNDKTKNHVMLPIDKKYQHINSKNFVEEAGKLVKRYDKEPKYYIRPLQSNCLFEILVNDFLVYKEYKLEKLATPIHIDIGILRSGTQTVSVRMYPIGDLIKETYGEGKRVDILLKKTQMKITVVKYPDSKNRMSLEDEEVVIEHSSPTKEGTQDFIGAGLDFFEYSFTFEAEVPYEIDGWMTGQDLTSLDSDRLVAQVLEYYKMVRSIYKKEDENALARLVFGEFIILSQGKYCDKNEIKSMWEEVKSNLYYEEKDFGDFEDYVMNFYGNGKIVALRHPSEEPVDHRLRGRSALWFKYKRKGRVKAFFPGLYLYLPKGESLESLRRIEY